MLLVVRFFAEITIKTRPVRRHFIRILRRNLLILLRRIDARVRISGEWDNFEVLSSSTDPQVLQQLQDTLANTPGIALVILVNKSPLPELEGILQETRKFYQDLLPGKTFAVRCRRQGNHQFSSMDVERYVGSGLSTENTAVNLTNPEVTVRINIRGDMLLVVKKIIRGLGGYPLGTQDAVLSLISGGFDSGVSSYQCIRRGMVTHYCFFRLGGEQHELAVKELALYLWLKFGASHKVKFVTVPFEGVVEEIRHKVAGSQMGVVLKRMMMRAASRIAADLNVQALVTGESIAQVSSQTLANLALIDSICDTMVLRPLIATDKQEIINLARKIGTEKFSTAIPEYCGAVSLKPTPRARKDRIEFEEGRIDFSLLEEAIEQREIQYIDRVVKALGNKATEPEQHAVIPAGTILIDIRHPNETESQPLHLSETDKAVRVVAIPFYRLHTVFPSLDKRSLYLLYCGKGMMSRLHASHLKDAGHGNVAVYLPN